MATNDGEKSRERRAVPEGERPGFFARNLPDLFGAKFEGPIEEKPPDWSSGIFGCLDQESKSIFDVGFICVGQACPILYSLNRLKMLKSAQGERLYMCSGHPFVCGDSVHAAALGLWYAMCAPCMGATNRARIRRSSGIPGAYAQDMLYHTLCPPCALAQEARHLRAVSYKGEKAVQIPRWRLALKACLPLTYQDRPVFDAVVAGDEALVRDLIANKGANVNCLDKDKTSPLMLAAVLGHGKVCSVLLELGADLHHTDRIQQSAIHRAAMKGHAKVVLDLWKAGGSCDQQDSFGRTPLDYSVGETKKLIMGCLGLEDQKTMAQVDHTAASRA